MEYLCEKQLTAGKKTYYPGDIIPDNVIFPERAGKLKRIGYISEISEKRFNAGHLPEGAETLYTQEEVEKIVADAVSKATEEMEQEKAELQHAVAELQDSGLSTFDGTIQISVRGETDGDNQQAMAIPASPEEIHEFFSIIQLNAEEGAKAIAEVKSENVLILLHAADSRKTIKNAAKERAANLFSINDNTHESTGSNEPTDASAEGDDA